MKPILIENELIVYFDCDETLIMHNKRAGNYVTKIKDPHTQKDSSVRPHGKHVKLLKQFKARGYTVVVWSAAGAKWANAVVNTLELEQYVDLIISKPLKYVDDLPAEQVLGSRIYLEYEE